MHARKSNYRKLVDISELFELLFLYMEKKATGKDYPQAGSLANWMKLRDYWV